MNITTQTATQIYVAGMAIVVIALFLDYSKAQKGFVRLVFKNLFWTAASFIAALLMLFSFALFMSKVLEKRMVWFNNFPLAYTVNTIPCVLGIIIAQALSNDSHVNEEDSFNATFWSVNIYTCIAMFALHAFELGTSCLFFFNLAANLLLKIVLYPMAMFIASLLPGKQVPIGRGACVVLAVLVLGILELSMIRTFMEFYIPIAGRGGTIVESDVILAAIFCLPLLKFVIPLILPFFRYFIKYSKAITVWSLALLFTILYICTSGIQPYAKEAPKRVAVQHTIVLDKAGKIEKSYLCGFPTDSIAFSQIPELANYSSFSHFSREQART